MTVQVMVAAPAGDEATGGTVFGGLPSAPAGETVDWPTCRNCGGAMQFLGQLAVDDALLLLFMCQNSLGRCEEWDADAGGNRVVVVAGDAPRYTLVPAPETGQALRNIRYGVRIVDVAASDYDEAVAAYDDSGPALLGQWAGTPAWIQADETPTCDTCQEPMRFVAQLEEGPDYATAMRFGGGGSAYVFRCATHGREAKLLWQSG